MIHVPDLPLCTGLCGEQVIAPLSPPPTLEEWQEVLSSTEQILRSSNKLLLLSEQLPWACLVLGHFLHDILVESLPCAQ